MGYNKETLKRALKEILDRGNDNKLRYEAYKNKCYAENPRLAEIDAEFMRLGPLMGMIAIRGDKDRLAAIKTRADTLVKEKELIKAKAGLTEFMPLCSHCEDTGYIGKNLCTCVLKRAKELSFAALSAEMPINECRFDNFSLDYYHTAEERATMQKVYDFCKKYASDICPDSKSVLFFGGTGLGKTHLSLAIASAALERGMGVVYSPAQNLLHKLEREHFSCDAETNVTSDVMDCDLLIIDDLGTEFSTSFTQATIYNIINTRILSGKPTVISTNLDFKELEERYTPRVTSRIMGEYTMKKFCGSDIRQQKRIERMEK